MNPGYELKTENEEEPTNSNVLNEPSQQIQKKISIPMIAGVLLIVAGILALISWIQVFMIDVTTLEGLFDITQFQSIYPEITPEQIVGFLNTCAIIGCIVAIFPILGGILSIKRKLLGIAIACSIIGLFSIGMIFTSSILSLIALILLIISRKDY
jgi:hypothetical protein